MTGFEQGVRRDLALAAIAAGQLPDVVENMVKRVAPLICPGTPSDPPPAAEPKPLAERLSKAVWYGLPLTLTSEEVRSVELKK